MLTGDITSSSFSPSPLYSFSWACSALESVDEMNPVGEAGKKSFASHFGTLFPSSGTTQSSFHLLCWSCLEWEAKWISTLHQTTFKPSPNPGLSELEISKEQITIKNVNCTSTLGVSGCSSPEGVKARLDSALGSLIWGGGFKTPSDLSHSMILWFYSSFLQAGSRINDSLCLQLLGFQGKKSLWTFNVSECDTVNKYS